MIISELDHGLLETKIKVGKQIIYVYTTHLEIDQEYLESQVHKKLLQKMSERGGLKILCGNMNAIPDNIAIKQISDIYGYI